MKVSILILVFAASHVFVLGQSKAQYKIWSEDCKDNKCFVMAYVAPENYTEINMQVLAQELTEKYKDREKVDFRVFNYEKIIKVYIEGAKESLNVLLDSRAYFIHRADCMDMLFYKSEENRVKQIELKWKDKEKCGGFIIFAREDETNAAPNKSRDVREKQRLSWHSHKRRFSLLIPAITNAPADLTKIKLKKL